ncbi:hypothetical protein C8J56DRAFT_1053170 [Mycena floridula]|nr:hypothetical protein C8J56DRAFT_1053170 [Mycena floridula]
MAISCRLCSSVAGFTPGFCKASAVDGIQGFNAMCLCPAKAYIVSNIEYICPAAPRGDDSDPDADPAWLPRERDDSPGQPKVSGSTLAEFPVLLLHEGADSDFCLVLRRSLVGPDGQDFGNRVISIQWSEFNHKSAWTWCSFQIVYLKRMRNMAYDEPVPEEFSPEQIAYLDQEYWPQREEAELAERKQDWRLLQLPKT